MSDRNEIPLATVGLIGVGVALWELSALPIFVLGAASVAASKYAPGTFKEAVKRGYKTGQRVKEFAAELQERACDIIAEARAEENILKDAEVAAEVATVAL